MQNTVKDATAQNHFSSEGSRIDVKELWAHTIIWLLRTANSLLNRQGHTRAGMKSRRIECVCSENRFNRRQEWRGVQRRDVLLFELPASASLLGAFRAKAERVYCCVEKQGIDNNVTQFKSPTAWRSVVQLVSLAPISMLQEQESISRVRRIYQGPVTCQIHVCNWKGDERQSRRDFPQFITCLSFLGSMHLSTLQLRWSPVMQLWSVRTGGPLSHSALNKPRNIKHYSYRRFQGSPSRPCGVLCYAASSKTINLHNHTEKMNK